MKKSIFAMLTVGLLLSGCLFSSSGSKQAVILNVPASDGTISQVPVELDRDGAWALTRISEEGTKVQFLKTKAAEFKAKEASAPKIVIDSQAEMQQYSQYKTVEVLGEAVKALAGVNDTYGVELTTTAIPKDVWAERIEAVGSAAKKVGNTPAGMILSASELAGTVLKNGAGGNNTNNTTNYKNEADGTLNVQDSNNSTKVVQVAGNDASTTISGNEAAAEMSEEESEGLSGRCRDNDSCPAGSVCSRQDGEVGQCISESAY